VANYFNKFIKIAEINKDNVAIIYPIYKDGINNGCIKYLYIDIINHILSAGPIIYKTNIKKNPVGLFIPNHPLFTSALISVLSQDFIAVPINPKSTKEIILKIISDNNLDVIITDNHYYQYLIGICSTNQVILKIGDIISTPSFQKIPKSQKKSGDIAIISYTSGTSGNPKGALITNKNILFVTMKYCSIYRLDKNSHVLAALPLWHNYGTFDVLLDTLISAGTIVLMDDWVSKKAIDIIHKYKISVFPGFPFMFMDIVNDDSRELDFSTLKVCESGGSGLPRRYIERFKKKTGIVITEGYGSAETTSLTHINNLTETRRAGSIGENIPEAFCKILDQGGRRVKTGECGVLWVRGPMVCKGYSNLKSNSFNGKWFNTGDIACLDSNNNYCVVGRLDNTKKVDTDIDSYSTSVGEILYEFDGLIKFNIKKKAGNNLDYLYVVLKDNRRRADFRDFLKSKFDKGRFYKIVFVKDIPITATGKIKHSLS
jgi:long-chain acyl-CoA synthetase